MSLINDLQWRYATKIFCGKKVESEKLQTIFESTVLAASSYGLQPFTVTVVNDQAIKIKLRAAAYNQPQLEQSDVVLVFSVPEKITKNMVEEFMKLTSATRNVPIEDLKGYQDTIWNSVQHLTETEQQHWAAKQAYISLGTALAAAAEQKVDACPMEGFERAKFDEILGLNEKSLKSQVIMCIGHRSEEDKLAALPKVRKPVNELFSVMEVALDIPGGYKIEEEISV